MKQKIGLLVDDFSASKQLKDFIDLSLTANNYEITTLIVNDHTIYSEKLQKKIKRYVGKKGVLNLLNRALFLIVSKIERKIIERKQQYKNFYRTYDLSENGFEVIVVSPIKSKSGLSHSYSCKDIEKIRNADLRLLVRAGKGILRGDILTCCPSGIISFHHGDNEINRGGPAGFWEVYKKQPRTGFIIQRLTEKLDGGDVLFKGFIRTSWFYTLNKVKLYEVSNPFLHKIIEQLTGRKDDPKFIKKIPYAEPLLSAPNNIHTMIYMFNTFSIWIKKVLNKKIGRRIRWGVAYQFTTNWQELDFRLSVKIKNRRNHFLADPFLVSREDTHYCFVEEYNYGQERGSISVYKITREGHSNLGSALVEDFHLAYPFLFEYKNNLYMCPDTHAVNDIRIYKCLDFPLKWEFERVLISNVSAVDTTIFFHLGKWWLMSNVDYSSVGEHYSQLHLYYNTSPIDDGWVPHESNPVVFDPLTARNGGFIVEESKLFRVYQRQDFDVYGKAFGVAEIKVLNTKEYVEESLFEIEPHFFPSLLGTHTLNHKDGLSVFDFSGLSQTKVNTW